MTCIEHYKRSLLAYTMARVDRIKYLHWHKHQLPDEVRDNLSPYELDLVRQYDQNLKQYAQTCGLGMDLTMDEAPPKSTAVQVRAHRSNCAHAADRLPHERLCIAANMLHMRC
jgi:hypothetical protein